jgi:hypothetical protein
MILLDSLCFSLGNAASGELVAEDVRKEWVSSRSNKNKVELRSQGWCIDASRPSSSVTRPFQNFLAASEQEDDGQERGGQKQPWELQPHAVADASPCLDSYVRSVLVRAFKRLHVSLSHDRDQRCYSDMWRPLRGYRRRSKRSHGYVQILLGFHRFSSAFSCSYGTHAFGLAMGIQLHP